MRQYKFIARVYRPFMGFTGHVVKNAQGVYFYSPKRGFTSEYHSMNYDELTERLSEKGYNIKPII